MGIHLLTEKLRNDLKTPLGILIKGSFERTLKEFKEIIEIKKPQMIISVGDALSRALIESDIFPKVLVVDNRIMRKPAAPFLAESYETVMLQNNSGTISDEAWHVLSSSVRQKGNVKVVVDGEEDLLTLVAIIEAPEGALVVYGQPNEGMVYVEVTGSKKNEIRAIVDSMESRVSKS